MIHKNIMDLTTTILAGLIVAAIAPFYLLFLLVDCGVNWWIEFHSI